MSNRVDARSGKTTNIIEFTGRDHPAFRATRSGTKRSPLESLNVVLAARAVSPVRVELVFRFVKPRINVRLFGRTFGLTLLIPVPGPFITSILFAFRPKKKPPPAYFVRAPPSGAATSAAARRRRANATRRPRLAPPTVRCGADWVRDAWQDVLYLDDDLRVHKTAQGNLFVQRRAGVEAAAA